MSLDKAGRRFRQILNRPSDKEKPAMVDSCKLLLEKLQINENSYCVTNIISPCRAAALAGVTSLEFWSQETELSEEDFFQFGDLDTDLAKLTQNLLKNTDSGEE